MQNNQKIPEGWSVKKLGDICHINKFSLSEKTSKDYKFKYIDLSSVDEGKIEFPTEDISFGEAPSRARRKINKNDIIMSTVRPNLKGFAFIDFDSTNFICSTGFAVLTAKEHAYNRYIYQLLYSKNIETQINNMLVGSNYPAINSSDVASLKFAIPPLAEQEKIAGILGTWDEVIEKLSSLIEQKKLLKKGLMQRLLTGKTRLKGFTQPWKEVKLGEVLFEHSQKSCENEAVCSVSVHKGVVNQVEHLGRSFSAANTSNYNLVHYGDVIYTKSPTGDFPYGIFKQSQQKNNVIVSPLYGVFTPKSYALGYILDSYFSYPVNMNNYLKPIIQKGAKNTINITNKTFLSKSLCLPTNIAEQKAISDVLSTADEEIDLLNKKLEALKEQKKGLMQQLLTGQIRVKVN